MEAACSSHRLLLLSSALHHLLLLLLGLPFCCHGLSLLPLRPGWSFAADLSVSAYLPLNGYQLQTPSLFMPLLSTSNFSSNKGFALGFLGLFPFSTSVSLASASIFLSVCLGTNATDYSGMTYAIPVWTWPGQSSPLKQAGGAGQVSLRGEPGRSAGGSDLVLRDGDGSEVWRVEDVVAMEMQDSGNWVLYNSANEVSWQSFDHPTDTLLQGQELYAGMKVVSSNSLYVMEMLPGGLLFYMQSQAPSPLYYWGLPVNISIIEYVAIHAFDLSRTPSVNLTAAFLSNSCPGAKPYTSLVGANLTINGSCISSSWPFSNVLANQSFPSDFVRLADSGVPQGYTYLRTSEGQNTLFSAQAQTSSCLPPRACGPYGICNSLLFGSKFTCSCPSVTDDARFAGAFRPADPVDMSQGCVRAQPLRCQAGSNITFGQLEGDSIASLHFLYEMNYMNNTYPIEECQARCAANCSCSGFFFESTSSFCLPFSDSGGLSNVSFLDINLAGLFVYVKIEVTHGDANGSDPLLGSTQTGFEAKRFQPRFVKPLVFAISALTAVFLITSLTILYLRRTKMHVWIRKDLEADSDAEEEDLRGLIPMLPTKHSYKDLHEATNGFKKLLGKGAHSRVYEGVLQDGRRVAVKRLDQMLRRQKQFLAEVATISGINHCNIVRLYGYCSQNTKKLLVYEFMENGSLDQWLFGKSTDRLLNWRTRFEIALGSARALAYLHEECMQPIIHFDVKPQNILLDKNFAPKVSDFGLAKLLEKESSCVMSGVRGTPGYLAPEWLSNSVVSKKCDVYGYGMVLFELLGGRRNTIQSLVGSDEWYFPAWAAIRCQGGGMLDLVDKRLDGRFDEDQVKVIMHLAFLCIQKEPHMRPTMGAVCKMLEGFVPISEKTPYSAALFEEPLSPQADFSMESCSNLKEGR